MFFKKIKIITIIYLIYIKCFQAQSKLPDIVFPHWVVRLAHNQPRRFSDEIIRQGEVVIPLQYGTNKCASQKGMKPYGLARQINFV